MRGWTFLLLLTLISLSLWGIASVRSATEPGKIEKLFAADLLAMIKKTGEITIEERDAKTGKMQERLRGVVVTGEKSEGEKHKFSCVFFAGPDLEKLDSKKTVDGLVVIKLLDGRTVKGQLTNVNDDCLMMRNPTGEEKILKTSILAIASSYTGCVTGNYDYSTKPFWAIVEPSPKWELCEPQMAPSKPQMAPSEPHYVYSGGSSTSDNITQIYYFKDGSVAGFVRAGVVIWYTEGGKMPDPETLLNPPRISDEKAKEPVPLEEAQNTGKVDIKLSSENDPLNAKLTVNNLSKSDLSVQVKPFTCFLAPDPSVRQNEIKAVDPIINVQAGKSATVDIDTYCVSTKSIKPPPPEGLKYKVGEFPDQEAFKKFVRIIAESEKLEKQGAFNEVPIKPEMRVRKITQTAIWIYTGKRSGKKTELVTVDGIKKDLLDSGSIERKKLSQEQLAQVGVFAQKIFDAAQQTLKASD